MLGQNNREVSDGNTQKQHESEVRTVIEQADTTVVVNGAYKTGALPLQIATVLIGIWWGVWLFIKLKLLWGLEYTSDLIIHTQKSRSFLYGLPILYDNVHGPHPYHNNFIELLLGPLTHFWGAIGLIIPLYLSYLLAVVYSVLVARACVPTAQIQVFYLAIGLMLGPVGFWTLDDLVYGWHPENFALPLCVILAAALLRQDRVFAIVSFVLLAAVHETAAVAACGVHILYREIVCFDGRLSFSARTRLWLKIGIPWLLVFISGLVLQRKWDPAGGDRLSDVLSKATHSPELLIAQLPLLWAQLLLLLVSCGFLIFGFTRRWRHALLTLLFCSPLILSGTLADLAYTFDVSHDMHNVFWSPRFSFIWGVVLAGGLFSAGRSASPPAIGDERLALHLESSGRHDPLRSRKVLLLIVAVFLTWTLQHELLKEIRAYDVVNRIRNTFHGELMAKRYLRLEQRVLKCLAKKIGWRVPIYVNPNLWGYFHAHDIERDREDNPYRRRPEVVICDTRVRDPFDVGCRTVQDKLIAERVDTSVDVRGLRVSYVAARSPEVSACLTKNRAPRIPK